MQTYTIKHEANGIRPITNNNTLLDTGSGDTVVFGQFNDCPPQDMLTKTYESTGTLNGCKRTKYIELEPTSPPQPFNGIIGLAGAGPSPSCANTLDTNFVANNLSKDGGQTLKWDFVSKTVQAGAPIEPCDYEVCAPLCDSGGDCAMPKCWGQPYVKDASGNLTLLDTGTTVARVVNSTAPGKCTAIETQPQICYDAVPATTNIGNVALHADRSYYNPASNTGDGLTIIGFPALQAGLDQMGIDYSAGRVCLNRKKA